MTALHPDLAHLDWLVGHWEGVGALVDPDGPEQTYVSEVVVSHDGRPFLAYSARSWRLEADGSRGEPGPSESGFWRRGAAERDVELVLAQPTGVVTVLLGEVVFRKVELVSDLVARTTTGRQVTGATRLYGAVEGGLAYVVEEAVDGRPLAPVRSARLSRVEG